MVVFLEKDSDFKWETRLGKFKKEGYVYEDGKLRKKIINMVVVRFGRIIKHFIIKHKRLSNKTPVTPITFLNFDTLAYLSHSFKYCHLVTFLSS